VPGASSSSACLRPATKLAHTAGEARRDRAAATRAAGNAHQREVGLVRVAMARERPGGFGERPVVVQARDHLHALAVAVREADAVYGLRPADVGIAVARDRDRVLVGQAAGHARAPQHFVADAAVDELVDALQLSRHASTLACTPVISSISASLKSVVMCGC